MPSDLKRRRGAATFRQRDVTAAIRAAETAGKRIARIEIGKDGTIVIIPHESAEPIPAETNPWDEE